MPKMRWTHEADLQLLVGLLQSIEHNVDHDKIATAWPTDAEARPTPRAVKERLSKIKDMAKLAGPKGLTSPTAAPSPKNKGESKSKEGDTGSQVSPHKRSRTTPSNKKKKDEPVETDEAENAEDDQPRSDEC